MSKINKRKNKNKMQNFYRRFFSLKTTNNFFDLSIKLDSANLSMIPLEKNHFSELSKILNFPELWTYNPRFNCKCENDVLEYLKFSLIQKEKKERYPLVIFNKEKAKIAGTSSYYNISPSNKTVSLGYSIITPEFQRTGLNRESKNMMLNWCFKEMDFERLDFHVDALNEKSITSLKKLGAIQEGILRSNILVTSGRRRDTAVLSILRNEWNQKH